MDYQDINAQTIDGWEWGKPSSHEVYEKAKHGEWDVYLTPTKAVPHEWIGGQLEAGFVLLSMYEDTNGEGRLHEMNIPTYLAMRSVKPAGT
jgi:hypothetical protein